MLYAMDTKKPHKTMKTTYENKKTTVIITIYEVYPFD